MPGLGGSIAETRPLAAGVRGTRIFLHLPGHGRSTPPSGGLYGEFADAVRAVADELGATRAFGVSLGAGALTRLIADTPDRFERVALYLPAVIDTARPAQTRDRLAQLTAALTDPDRLRALVLDELPRAVRNSSEASAYVQRRVGALRVPAVAALLPQLAEAVAIDGRAQLTPYAGRLLVVGCEGDPLHPADVARELAGCVPSAILHVFDAPGPLWTERSALRGLITGFLNSP